MTTKHTLVRWALLDQALISAANFTTSLLLVRVLSVGEYGSYVLLWTFVQLALALQAAVLMNPMQSLAGGFSTTERAGYILGVHRLSFGWAVFTAAVGGLVFTGWVMWFKINGASELVLPFIVWLALAQVQEAQRKCYFAADRPLAVFALDLSTYPVQVVGIFFILSSKASLHHVIWIVSGSMTVGMCVAALGASRSQPAFSAQTILRRHWASAKWLLASTGVQWLSANFLYLAAASAAGAALIGSVRAAQNVMGLLHVVYQAAENILPLKAAEKMAKSGQVTASGFLAKQTAKLVLLSAGVSSLIALSGPFLLPWIYGKNDPIAIQATLWFVPVYVLLSAAITARVAARTIEKTRPIFIGNMLAAGFTLVYSGAIASNMTLATLMTGLLCGAALQLAPPLLSFIAMRRPKA